MLYDPKNLANILNKLVRISDLKRTYIREKPNQNLLLSILQIGKQSGQSEGIMKTRKE